MKGRRNYIDKIIQEKFRNFREVPPSDVWEGVATTINKDARRKKILWISRVAAGVAILLFAGLTYLMVRNGEVTERISEQPSEVKTEQAATKTDRDETGGKDDQVHESLTIQEEAKEDQRRSPLKDDRTGLTVLSDQQYPERKDIYGEDYLSPADEVETLQAEMAYQPRIYIHNIEFHTGLDSFDQQLLAVLTEPDKHERKNKRSREIILEDIGSGDETGESKWAIGGQLSPVYSYRNLSTSNNDASYMVLTRNIASSNLDQYNRNEEGLMTYAGGINIHYMPLKRLAVQSGVYYSKLGLSVDHEYIIGNSIYMYLSSGSVKYQSVSNSSGVIDVQESDVASVYATNYYGNAPLGESQDDNVDRYDDVVSRGEIIQHFEYIEVPMILRYKLIDRKLDFNMLGGISTNILIGSNTFFKDDGDKNKIGETTGLKPVNYSSILGVGLEYSISSKLFLNLEPTFKYYLNSINESSDIRSYPYAIGVFTGLSYYF